MAVVTETMAHGIELKVCMGSACHQKGVSVVVPILERLVDENDLKDIVELKGAFCLGPCLEGIVIQLGDRQFTLISPANIEQRFREEILPAIRSEVDE